MSRSCSPLVDLSSLGGNVPNQEDRGAEESVFCRWTSCRPSVLDAGEDDFSRLFVRKPAARLGEVDGCRKRFSFNAFPSDLAVKVDVTKEVLGSLLTSHGSGSSLFLLPISIQLSSG